MSSLAPSPAPAPTSSARRHRRLPRKAGWFASTALLLLAPKCVGCVWAYLALFVGISRAGQELCGAAPGGSVFTSWSTWTLPVIVVIGAGYTLTRRQRCRSVHTKIPD